MRIFRKKVTAVTKAESARTEYPSHCRQVSSIEHKVETRAAHVGLKKKLPGRDLNPDYLIQSQACYRYTTRQEYQHMLTVKNSLSKTGIAGRDCDYIMSM